MTKRYLYTCALFASSIISISATSDKSDKKFVILVTNIKTGDAKNDNSKTTYLNAWLVRADLNMNETFKFLFGNTVAFFINNKNKAFKEFQVLCMDKKGKVMDYYIKDAKSRKQATNLLKTGIPGVKIEKATTFANFKPKSKENLPLFTAQEVTTFLQEAYDLFSDINPNNKNIETADKRFMMTTAWDLVLQKEPKKKSVVVQASKNLDCKYDTMVAQGINLPQYPKMRYPIEARSSMLEVKKERAGYFFAGVMVGYLASYLQSYLFSPSASSSSSSSRRKRRSEAREIVVIDKEDGLTAANPVIIPGKVPV